MSKPTSDVEIVMQFLKKNGLKHAESALKVDITERNHINNNNNNNNKEVLELFEQQLGSFDFEKFLFLLPPVKTPASLRRSPERGGSRSSSSGSGSDDEFVSLRSSISGICSSEFTNPYGLHSWSEANSDTSSDRLSQFGTARDYPDFDIQNDLYWREEKDKEAGYFDGPSEDKFVTPSEAEKQHENLQSFHHMSEVFEPEESLCFLDKPCLCKTAAGENEDHYRFNRKPDPGHIDLSSKKTDLDGFMTHTDTDIDIIHKEADDTDYSKKRDTKTDWIEEFKSISEIIPYRIENHEVNEEANELDEGEVETDEVLMCHSHEDEYEVFDLRIIHRKNRTGFEESKDLPIVLNSVLASRYCVTEYLGSAAFSKVVQARDLHTGVDVCLKIIKNDKDFFDQSLDEIKLLKLVNKHDPADERHILRLYDYFYHQEHLFIVCELLKANLYEFQKFNQESGGEAYFNLARLQMITRQCLEALEYLHHLGIIHCDLKPENILIKSYRRCEIKVIDLGSSCFRSDNLCLYVQSRSYRAPEVILGLPYDEKIDLWSLGCILAELSSGEVLFPNDSVVIILARMIGMLGPIDLEMLERGQEVHKYFSTEYDLYHTNEETDQLEYVIPEESSLKHHLQTTDTGFIDFVTHLLEVNPARRPTATEALKHPWLSHPYESNAY